MVLALLAGSAAPALASPPDTQVFVSDQTGLTSNPFLVQTTAGSASVALAPQPVVQATGTPVAGNEGILASAHLHFQVAINPAAYAGMNFAGSGTLTVPLGIAFGGLATASSSPGNFALASSKIYISSEYDGSYAVQQLESCSSVAGFQSGVCGPYAGATVYNFNYLYYYNGYVYPKPLDVLLETTIQASSIGSTAMAVADPIFTLPANSGLSLILSDGVGNTPTTIPEPAAWALLLTGFGLAGIQLRRQRALA